MEIKYLIPWVVLALVPVWCCADQEIYRNDFEQAVGPEWSSQTRSSTPIGNRQFLGEFGSGSIRLTLNQLPPHTAVTVVFDLFILKSWDGQGPEGDPSGPDKWGFFVDDSDFAFVTTFSNHLPGDSSIYPEGKAQKYPSEWPDGENMPAYSGASETDSLGYSYHGPMDAVYHITFTFDHESTSLGLSFWADLTNGIPNESWGLDNVVVSIVANTPPIVLAGPDRELYYPPDRIQLAGVVRDDGLPRDAQLTTAWSVLSSPGPVIFEPNEFVLDPMVILSLPGDYALRLTANDGLLEASDDVVITYRCREKIYVDPSAKGAGDGVSWADAFTCLQDALMFAGIGSEIRVAESVYRPNEFVWSDRPSLGRAETFQLKSGVAIYGGFPAGGGTWEERDPEGHPTILSGDLAANDDTAWPQNRDDNVYHVVTGSGTDQTAVLDGFVIMGGNADGSESPDYLGGGLLNYEGSPTIRNCIFCENWAKYGGGMNNYSRSHPIIENCRFIDNHAHYKGGGLYTHNGTPDVSRCTFRGNSAGWLGGGVYNNFASPKLSNCLIANNTARYGGGMCNYGRSEPEAINCTISQNAAVDGGGVYDYPEATTTLGNCILWANRDVGGQDATAQITSDMAKINHSTVQGWHGADPLFADPNNGDFHLQSHAGRWDPQAQMWVSDYATSPAIDAGSPFDDVGDETEPNGRRINQGVYGGTAEASKSLAGQFNVADLNRDGIVDIRDHAILAENWLKRNE